VNCQEAHFAAKKHLCRKEEKLKIEKLPIAAAWASNELRRKLKHTKVSQGCGSTANIKLRGMRGGVATGAENTR